MKHNKQFTLNRVAALALFFHKSLHTTHEEIAMITKKPVHTGEVKVTFSLPKDHSYGKVSVVGDFNDWDPMANPLKNHSKKYSTSVVLEAEKQYLFRYLCEDGCWINDPEADNYEPSGFGSDNGVLLT